MVALLIADARIRVRTIHKKTGPDRFSNFMSFGLADSVPGPVVANGNEMCKVSCS